MTERKPPGMRFETWVDRVIRDGQERGEFDDLAGAGRPIAGLDTPLADDWWVRGLLRREEIEHLPPSLALKKEAEATLAEALDAPSEAEARRLIEGVNGKIRTATRLAIAGPPVLLFPYDVVDVLDRRRARLDARSAPESQPASGGGGGAEPPRRRWWTKRRRSSC